MYSNFARNYIIKCLLLMLDCVIKKTYKGVRVAEL
jgi:hypothetical protein